MAQLARTVIGCLLATQVWALPDDRQQAIEINADEAVINEQANAATYRGSVDVRQGSFVLTADRLDLALDSTGAVSRMEAAGTPATFQSKRRATDTEPVRGQANTLRYTLSTATVQLVGAAKITLDGSTFEGPEIRYHTETGEITGSGTRERRVQMIFAPPSGKP